MKISNVGAQALFLLSLSSPFALGCTELENVSFENGNFDCWTTDFTDVGGVVITTDASFTVPYGTYMAKIGGGNFTNKISRIFNVPIEGQAAWDGDENDDDFNDSGMVRIVESGTVVFEASIADYGLKGNSDWMPFTYASPTNSPYTLEVISTNDKDVLFDSHVYFDVHPISPGTGGDPHFKTWKNEHFQYHGQCDLVLAKDANFADGLGLDIHIRTKLVRYWSFIKTAVIRIGNDILEIEGSTEEYDSKIHYWHNYECQAELETFAGFPVKQFNQKGTRVTKNRMEIDLSSKYPGVKINISTYKEFVKVSFDQAIEEAFGNTVGMLGDFKTGKTLARDGSTELNDWTDYGREWQVLPADGKLFRRSETPQFPELCLEPENPQGSRARRLAESSISEEQAEKACASIKDELDRKDCVYDIIATQDLDMVGAF